LQAATDLQNAARFEVSAVPSPSRKLQSNNNLAARPDYGSRVAPTWGCPVLWRRVFWTLKAQKAGGDLLTFQESLK